MPVLFRPTQTTLRVARVTPPVAGTGLQPRRRDSKSFDSKPFTLSEWVDREELSLNRLISVPLHKTCRWLLASRHETKSFHPDFPIVSTHSYQLNSDVPDDHGTEMNESDNGRAVLLDIEGVRLRADNAGDRPSSKNTFCPFRMPRHRVQSLLVLLAGCCLLLLVSVFLSATWKSANFLPWLPPTLKSMAALATAGALGTGTALARGTTWKAICCNLAAVAAACFIFFGFIAYRSSPDKLVRTSEPKIWTTPNSFLGYLPLPNRTFRWKESAGREQIYDVKVSTGPHGWRVTPPAPSASRSLLFFGCSFTFGAGLNDEESYPYRVAVKTGGRFAVHNFGQSGWGPNQMLSLLEHNLAEEVVRQPPQLAVFLTIPDHLARSEGLGPHSDSYPRYVLNSLGQAVAAGTFAGKLNPLNRTLRDLNISWIKATGLFSWPFLTHDTDQLYLAIVLSARDQIQRRFPRCRFEVVLWGPDPWVSDTWGPRMEAGLRKEGISVHNAEEFLPGVRQNPDRYRISRRDSHPNALAADLMAGFVVHRLLCE